MKTVKKIKEEVIDNEGIIFACNKSNSTPSIVNDDDSDDDLFTDDEEITDEDITSDDSGDDDNNKCSCH